MFILMRLEELDSPTMRLVGTFNTYDEAFEMMAEIHKETVRTAEKEDWFFGFDPTDEAYVWLTDFESCVAADGQAGVHHVIFDSEE